MEQYQERIKKTLEQWLRGAKMAMRQFGTAFPWGAPKPTDYGAPLRDITELIKTIQGIKKTKYETELTSNWLDELDKKGNKEDISTAITRISQLEPAEQASELLKIKTREGRTIPKLMEQREEAGKPAKGIFRKTLKGARTLFDPSYIYRGETTDIEKTILAEKRKEEYEKEKDYYSLLVSGINSLQGAAKPPTAAVQGVADSKARFFQAADTGNWLDAQGKSAVVRSKEQLASIARIEKIYQDPEVMRAIETFEYTPGKEKKVSKYHPMNIIPGGKPFREYTPAVEEKRTYEKPATQDKQVIDRIKKLRKEGKTDAWIAKEIRANGIDPHKYGLK